MQVTFDPANDADLALVRLLLNEDAAPAPAPAKKAVAPAAPAKKAAAAPAEAEEPGEAPATNGGEEGEGPTLADAVARATDMVSNGQAAQVKAALTTVGAKRVSELEEDKIADFLAALDS
jgi:hypothetical protein